MGMIMRDGIPYGGNSGSSSDTNVTQIQSSDNADYEVLLGGSADELTHTESAKKSNKLKVNPSTGDISMTGDIKLTGTGNTWDGKNTSIKSAFDEVQYVKQSEIASTDADYEVLLSGTADNITRVEGANKSEQLTFNPSSGELSATTLTGDITGNALTRTQVVNALNYTPLSSSDATVEDQSNRIVKRDNNGGIFGKINGLTRRCYEYDSVPSSLTSYLALTNNHLVSCVFMDLNTSTELPVVILKNADATVYAVAWKRNGESAFEQLSCHNDLTSIANQYSTTSDLSFSMSDYNPNKGEKCIKINNSSTENLYYIWLWIV